MLTSQKPMKLLWPSDVFCQMSPHKLKLMVEFVESVETTFAVKRTNFSMSQLWREKCPVEPYVPIEDYLDAVRYLSTCRLGPTLTSLDFGNNPVVRRMEQHGLL